MLPEVKDNLYETGWNVPLVSGSGKLESMLVLTKGGNQPESIAEVYLILPLRASNLADSTY